MQLGYYEFYIHRYYILNSMLVGVLFSSFYIGLFESIIGTLIGLCMFVVSYVLKFIKFEEGDQDGYNAFGFFQLAIVFFICSLWYSSIFLFYHGIEAQGRIIKKRSETKVEGIKESAKVVTHYYFVIDNYESEVELNDQYNVGDTIRYLYAQDLKDNFDYFIVMGPSSDRFQAILRSRGFFFYASVVYTVCIFTVWFISLHTQGKILLAEKLNKSKSQSQKIVSCVFYYLSYGTFILFVLAIFKNIYNVIPFKFWYIAATSLVLIIILLTDLGERTFALSTNIILDLKSYCFLAWIKQIIKVIGYLTFALLLYKSLITTQKSVFDLIFEFLDKHFDIDLKSVFN